MTNVKLKQLHHYVDPKIQLHWKITSVVQSITLNPYYVPGSA